MATQPMFESREPVNHHSNSSTVPLGVYEKASVAHEHGVLILGLEGLLVSSLKNPIVHPDTGFLMDSQISFQKTIIWSLGEINEAIYVAKNANFLPYIDGIVGEYRGKNREPSGIYALADVHNGEISKKLKRLSKTAGVKDLRAISPYLERMAMLEPEYTLTDLRRSELLSYGIRTHRIAKTLKLGEPESRIVYVPDFHGQKDHHLRPYFEQAFQKFLQQ